MRQDRINLTTTLGGNTGRTTGDVRMGRIKIILPTRGKVFTSADIADSESFKAALAAALKESRTSLNKIFVFDGFREAEDNTGDPNVATMADGYEEVLNEAVPKYTLRNTKGAAQQMALTAFNGWNDPVFIVDDKNILWYIGTSDGGAKGFSTGSFYANPPRFGGTGAISSNLVKLSFGSIEEFKSGIGAMKLDLPMPMRWRR